MCGRVGPLGRVVKMTGEVLSTRRSLSSSLPPLTGFPHRSLFLFRPFFAHETIVLTGSLHRPGTFSFSLSLLLRETFSFVLSFEILLSCLEILCTKYWGKTYARAYNWQFSRKMP